MATFNQQVGNATLRLIVNLQEQDTPGNRSRLSWELQLICTNGISWNGDPTGWRVDIGPSTYRGSYTFDFRGTSTVRIATGSTWVGHTASGTLTVALSGWTAYTGTSAIGGPATVSGSMALPAISRVPPAPTSLGVDQITTTQLRYQFQSTGTGGSPIIRWEAQYATNSGFAGATTILSGGTSTIAGLTPGATYWLRSRGVNAVGAGAWSAVMQATTLLDAPALTGWAQNTTGELVATWSPPAPATALTGYRLQLATNDTFTAGLRTIDTSNTTATVGGLPGGITYYARVATRSTGGSSAYSATLAALLVLDSGNLDGWTRVGAPPAALRYYTPEGLRRGVVGTRQALWLESLTTGPVTVPYATIGIQRDMVTTPGRTYTLRVTLTARADALVSTYRSEVPGMVGDPTPVGTAGTELPPLAFIATTTRSRVRIMLAEPINTTGERIPVERVAVSDIRLLEAATDYPQRLRSTVYESDLASHFDLACNSVGAAWYADKDDQTRFSLPGAALPISAMFSDRSRDGALSYTDIDVGHDTKSMVNTLEATNHGVAADGNAADDKVTVNNPVSVSLYGPRSEKIDVNLDTLPPYDGAFTGRLAAILDSSDEPQLLISSCTWNAQQDMDAANALELTQRVEVEFDGTVQDSQLIGLDHTITPTRWMITARFAKI